MGDCYIATEVRIHIDSEGHYRAKHRSAAYDAWKPFVDAFKSVIVLARVDSDVVSDEGPYVEGHGVSVHPLPYYHGAMQLPRGLWRVRRALRQLGDPSDVFIGRVPEFISLEVMKRAHHLNARTLVMLVADPAVIRHALPRLAGSGAVWIMRDRTRKAIRRATAVSYVSQSVFQTRYPAPPGTPVIGRSNVILEAGWLANKPREHRSHNSLRLVTVGSLASSVKGMDFLLRVVEFLTRSGTSVCLTIVGAGPLERGLRQYAAKNCLNVKFAGHIHNTLSLRALLDTADIYVSGSRSEGLPRSTVEAMARGLPVVTTAAGAASELVDGRFVVPIDSVSAFSRALSVLANNPHDYRQQSMRSIQNAALVAQKADPGRFAAFLREHLQVSK